MIAHPGTGEQIKVVTFNESGRRVVDPRPPMPAFPQFDADSKRNTDFFEVSIAPQLLMAG